MPGFNPDDINIHDLTVEEPEKQAEAFFDVEKEIKPEYWEKYLAWFEKTREWAGSRDRGVIGGNASYLKILGRPVDLSQDEKDMIVDIDVDSDKDFLYDILSSFEYAKILGLDVELPDSINKQVLDDADFRIDRENVGSYAEKIKTLAICGKSHLIPESVKSALVEYLHEKESSGAEFMNIALALKFLGINPAFSDDDWRAMREELNSHTDFSGYELQNFFRVAADLKILASEKVEITDKGIEITMPLKNLPEMETSAIPEQRKF